MPVDPTLTPDVTTFDEIAGSLRRLVHLAESRSAESSALLSKIALAELLSVSPRKIDGMVSAGRCPKPIRLGKLRRWRRAEMEEWIAGGCAPVSEWTARQSSKKDAVKFSALAKAG